MHKKCYLQDFKKLPNQNSIDILMQTLKALFVANSKVSTNASLVRIYLKMGAQGMFCSSKLQRAWWGGWPGGAGWRAGRGGGVGLAGQGGGWPGGRRGMDLRSKECSGVDIVT